MGFTARNSTYILKLVLVETGGAGRSPAFALKKTYRVFSMMQFFRQYLAPAFVVLIFLLALLAVSARIFLPNDLAAPAPVSRSLEAVQALHG